MNRSYGLDPTKKMSRSDERAEASSRLKKLERKLCLLPPTAIMTSSTDYKERPRIMKQIKQLVDDEFIHKELPEFNLSFEEYSQMLDSVVMANARYYLPHR